jgi:hypothetical protein
MLCPSYSGGRDRKTLVSGQPRESYQETYLNDKLNRGARTGGVAQTVECFTMYSMQQHVNIQKHFNSVNKIARSVLVLEGLEGSQT